ncbi:hypothetical protein ASG37_00025 [Sphingomonas sp. Leaf407]|uniref:3-keto-disaccharide hydrolase n=1 Tax=unclassified Sphingomonas TaxID=196159 RepID=UPI0006F8A51E|nr:MULTISPECIES: DUF1080 domain-containing protein [unclassified Sphingomonas]KQN40252.1 hypothetical protein ASE97_00055 [Sphingomonas sp. Leaf42]KQT29606.1 hypothetical protein ASG37_00025 [Sphingomonas sp. Leaf407]
MTIRTAALIASALVIAPAGAQDKPGFRDTPTLPDGKWRVHDADRPAPTVVVPAATPGGAPADAVMLFDGRSTAAWVAERSMWPVAGGALTIPARATSGGENNLRTKQGFGDVQLHLEFRSPNPPTKTSQDRGNSGIWFMDRYEVQILDGWRNPTYADGTIGAVYGWKPPLVNAARAPGEWQSYDVVFERPRFAADGTLVRPAYVTAFLNGVLVQNHQAMLGETAWRQVARYTAHADTAPIRLQDHDSPVSFRNIWVRPLGAEAIAQDLPEKAR